MFGKDDTWFAFLCEESKLQFSRKDPRLRSYTTEPSACTCYDCLLEYKARELDLNKLIIPSKPQ
jgi:hypothetical protein